MSLTKPYGGEGSWLDPSKDSSEDNCMVEEGFEGMTLIGHPKR